MTAAASEREELARRLRAILKHVKNDPGIASVAREVDVSRTTIHSLLSGATPSWETLSSLKDWVRAHEYEYLAPEMQDDVIEDHTQSVDDLPKEGQDWVADRDGSPAERLIYYLQHSEVLRRFAGDPIKAAVQAAFGVAIEEDFSDRELAKLQSWRNDIRIGEYEDD